MSTAESGELTRAQLEKKLAELVAARDGAAVLELVGKLVADNDELAARNDALSEQVRQRDVTIKHYRRLLFGRRSEKLTAEELSQLVLDYGGSAEQAQASEPTVPVPECEDAEPEETEPKRRKRRKHPGRTSLSPDLERVVHVSRTACTDRPSSPKVIGGVRALEIATVATRENRASGRLN